MVMNLPFISRSFMKTRALAAFYRASLFLSLCLSLSFRHRIVKMVAYRVNQASRVFHASDRYRISLIVQCREFSLARYLDGVSPFRGNARVPENERAFPSGRARNS